MLDEKFYSPKDIAEKLNVSSNTIRTLCDNGEIEALKIGTQYRITESSLQNYLTKSKLKGE